MNDKPLLVIIGPTAVGKTALSVRLAQDFEIEIVSADSRQIYRQLNLGTAKPTAQEQAAAPHHLIDIVDPDEILSLADFQERAYAAIEDILGQRRHLPLLVGGTGQWVKAVVEGWNIPRVAPDMVLRAELEAVAHDRGVQELHAQLEAVDRQSAEKIDPRNVRRVVRALEVYQKTGVPISEQQNKQAPPFKILQVGLTMSREMLYMRIDQRVETMMAGGLLAEVARLEKAGYGWKQPAMMSLGYRQIGQYLRGEVSLDEAVALIKKETRRFVRQQYNWFRLDDERIHWIDISSGLPGRYPDIKMLVEIGLAIPARS